MTYQLRQFGSSLGSFFEAKASFGTSLVSPREPLGSSLLPPALAPHSFYAKLSQTIFLSNSFHSSPLFCRCDKQMKKVSYSKISERFSALKSFFSAKESEDQVNKLILEKDEG